jgi:hypothetical protein
MSKKKKEKNKTKKPLKPSDGKEKKEPMRVLIMTHND